LNELLPHSAVQFLILWVKQSRSLVIIDSWQMASCLLPCTAIPLHHVVSFNWPPSSQLHHLAHNSNNMLLPYFFTQSV
jgi:hypothetical protein